MNYKNVLLALITLLLLTACNLPVSSTATPTADAMATQVSMLLTEMPTATVSVQTIAPAFPTNTPTSQAATEIPVTPTVTPTLASDSPAASLGSPSWQDSLDSGKSFYLFENENTRVTQENGYLVLTGLTANGWHGWSLTFTQQPKNFYLEGVLIPQNCSGSDLYGLVFRAEDVSSGYFFGVTCDGRYNLTARNFEDGTDIQIIQLTENQAIRTGANMTNVLSVKAEGERIALYANGTLLSEVTDSTYAEGYFGVFVAANQTPGFTVWLDEIKLWNLP